jgi:hypothetical protein
MGAAFAQLLPSRLRLGRNPLPRGGAPPQG